MPTTTIQANNTGNPIQIRLSKKWLISKLVPFLLTAFPAIIDLINGYYVMTGKAGFYSLGVIFRGIIMLASVYCMLKLKNLLVVKYILLILMIWLLSNCLWIIFSDVYSLQFELKIVMKLIFPWCLTTIFFLIDKKYTLSSEYLFSLITWWGIITAFSLILSFYYGFGFQTYGDYSYGVKSFFNAQNDIGLALLLALTASINLFVRNQQGRNIIKAILIIMACLLLATRTGFIGPILIIIVYLLSALINKRILFKNKNNFKTIIFICIIIGTFAILFSYFIKNYQSINYLITKLESLREATPRHFIQQAGLKRIENRNIILTLFGEGGLSFQKNVARNVGWGSENEKFLFKIKKVENDIFDVFGYYGLLSFIIIYTWYCIIYLICLKNIIVAFKLENLTLFIIVTLFLGHSSLAGHCIFSASVSSIIAPCFFLLLKNINNQLDKNNLTYQC